MKRQRTEVARFINTNSTDDYFLFWYTGTQCYSQTFGFYSPALSIIEPQERRNLKAGEQVELRNGTKKEAAILIIRGPINKLLAATKRLDAAISQDSEFDTDRAINLDLSSSDSDSDSKSSDDEIIDKAPTKKQCTTNLLNKNTAEKNKLDILRQNYPQRSQGCSNWVNTTTPKSGLNSKVVDSTPDTPAKSKFVSNDTSLHLSKKILEAINKTNRLLSTLIDIQSKSNTDQTIRTDVAEFECHDGKKIDISSINRYEPNTFARHFLILAHGKENLQGRLFSCKGKTDRIVFTNAECEDVRKVTLAKFPNSNWKSVESSLNQFLRDLNNPKRHSL